MSDSAKAVFLSYASQDADAARRICESLRTAGVEVWLDADGGLEHGDEWDAKIRRQIKECVLFIPLISANTQARHEGYFRIEWDMAAERARGIASGVAFILPVVIDDTREPDALVPDKFRTVQWTRLRSGEMTPEIKARFLKLWSHRTGVLKHEATASAAPAPALVATRSANGRWALAAVAVVLIGAGTFWFTGSPSSHRPPPSAPTAALPSIPTDKSIAVLPFENAGDDKEDMAFTEGMHDAILTTLFNVRQFRLAGSDAVRPYRDTAKPNAQIARELNTAYVLRGTVRRAGRTIRVTGRLVQAQSGEEVWRNDYPARELTTENLFAIQETIAKEIAAALKTTLSPEESRLLASRPTESLDAYELVLQARKWGRTFVGEIKGGSRYGEMEKLLLAAVKADPGYALAHAELSHLYAIPFSGGDVANPLRDGAKAKAAIDQAVRLAPESADVVRALGEYHLYVTGDLTRASDAFARYGELRPNDPAYFGALGDVLVRQNRLAEAARSWRRQADLDPGDADHLARLVLLYQYGRRWDEAIEMQRRIVERAPGNPEANYYLGYLIFQKTGSAEIWNSFWSKLSPGTWDTPRARGFRVQWAAATGNDDELLRMLAAGQVADDLVLLVGASLAIRDRVNEIRDPMERVRRKTLDRVASNSGPSEVAMLWLDLAYIDALLGNRAEALRQVATSDAIEADRTPVRQAYAALVLAWAGEKERAIELYATAAPLVHGTGGPLEVSDWEGFFSSHNLRKAAAFAPLRGNPRFEAILSDPKNNEPLF